MTEPPLKSPLVKHFRTHRYKTRSVSQFTHFSKDRLACRGLLLRSYRLAVCALSNAVLSPTYAWQLVWHQWQQPVTTRYAASLPTNLRLRQLLFMSSVPLCCSLCVFDVRCACSITVTCLDGIHCVYFMFDCASLMLTCVIDVQDGTWSVKQDAAPSYSSSNPVPALCSSNQHP